MEPFPGSPHVRWMESHCFLEGEKAQCDSALPSDSRGGRPQGGMGSHGALFSSRLRSHLALRPYCTGTCTTATMKGASHLPFY